MNRKYFKDKAKEIISKDALYLVVLMVIISISSGILNFFTSVVVSEYTATMYMFNEIVLKFDFNNTFFVSQMLIIYLLVQSVISLFASYYLANLFRIRVSKTYNELYPDKVIFDEKVRFDFKTILILFSVNIIMTVLIIVGSILFIVPGIIVALAFSFNQYVIATSEDRSVMGVISENWAITKGRKGDIFVLGLSFILWGILVAVINGLVGANIIGDIVSLITNSMLSVYITTTNVLVFNFYRTEDMGITYDSYYYEE